MKIRLLLPCVSAFLLLASIPSFGQVRISQIYGAGGNAGATYSSDYVELFNAGASSASLTGYSLQYASTTGTSWTNKANLTGSIPAGGYFLVQMSAVGAVGVAIPTPDLVNGAINMSASAGKVALVSNQTVITSGTTCPSGAGIVDFVPYGTTSVGCAPNNPTASISATLAAFRAAGGCTDTDNSASDFTVAAAAPRNSSNAVNLCGGGATPTLSINDVSLNEGNSGATNFTFTVSLSAPAGVGGVTFDIATADNSATTANNDYVATSLFSQTIPSGSSTYTFTVLVNGDTTVEPNETFFVNVTNVVGATVSDGQGLGTILNDDGPPACSATATISQIQGSGATSPLVGTTQTTQGIVTFVKSSGFFMQSNGDGDPLTSDAVFVFTSSAPTVTLGSSVCVTGAIAEFQSAATASTDPVNPLTEINTPTVSLLSTGNPLPAAVTLSLDPNGAKDQAEKYESMRVSVATMTVVGPSGDTINEANATATNDNTFWGVVQGTLRPFREPGLDSTHIIAGTAPVTVPRWDSNPELIQVFTGNPGVTALDVSVGAIISGISGVLDIFHGGYEIDLDAGVAPTVTNNTLSFTAVPAPLASELTVATANLERFYDTVDDPSTSDVVLTPAALTKRLKKASLQIRNVMKSPDVVAVEEMENLGVLQTLATQISNDAIAAGQTDPQYAAYLVEGNDIGGIDVGFLVNPNRVTVSSVTQFGKSNTFIDPDDMSVDVLNDRPPLLLTGTAHNGARAGLPIAVFVNHSRSLSAADDPTLARVRAKREAQAEYLAGLIQARQVANPNELMLSVGDYNAFEFNDGLADVVGVVSGTPALASQVLIPPGGVLVSPALTELSTALLPASARYSYSFSGSAQSLDHILVNPKALSRISRFAIGHSNSEFSFSYRNDDTRPERISDHDPEVAYLNLPAAVDVTSSISFTATGLVYNRGTQLYNGSVTVTNTSGSTLAGPLQLGFQNLPSGVTLQNATMNLGGIPYITSGGTLAPGASVTVAVQFKVVSGAVGYVLNVYSGGL